MYYDFSLVKVGPLANRNTQRKVSHLIYFYEPNFKAPFQTTSTTADVQERASLAPSWPPVLVSAAVDQHDEVQVIEDDGINRYDQCSQRRADVRATVRQEAVPAESIPISEEVIVDAASGNPQDYCALLK